MGKRSASLAAGWNSALASLKMNAPAQPSGTAGAPPLSSPASSSLSSLPTVALPNSAGATSTSHTPSTPNVINVSELLSADGGVFAGRSAGESLCLLLDGKINHAHTTAAHLAQRAAQVDKQQLQPCALLAQQQFTSVADFWRELTALQDSVDQLARLTRSVELAQQRAQQLDAQLTRHIAGKLALAQMASQRDTAAKMHEHEAALARERKHLEQQLAIDRTRRQAELERAARKREADERQQRAEMDKAIKLKLDLFQQQQQQQLQQQQNLASGAPNSSSSSSAITTTTTTSSIINTTPTSAAAAAATANVPSSAATPTTSLHETPLTTSVDEQSQLESFLSDTPVSAPSSMRAGAETSAGDARDDAASPEASAFAFTAEISPLEAAPPLVATPAAAAVPVSAVVAAPPVAPTVVAPTVVAPTVVAPTVPAPTAVAPAVAAPVAPAAATFVEPIAAATPTEPSAAVEPNAEPASEAASAAAAEPDAASEPASPDAPAADEPVEEAVGDSVPVAAPGPAKAKRGKKKR